MSNDKKEEPECNLMAHARRELQAAGFFDKDSFYGGMTGKAVMELMVVFSNQNHSGSSAQSVNAIFSKLADYQPLTAITGEDSEWHEAPKLSDGSKGLQQNIRLGSLFKDDKGASYSRAIIFVEPSGTAFSGSDVDGVSSTQYVHFPFIPKTFYVDVVMDKDDNHSIKDRTQLDPVFKYYKKGR